MAIPEGYRLFTVEDVGKTFGVDLEPVVYFDTGITGFFEEYVFYNIYFNNSEDTYIYYYNVISREEKGCWIYYYSSSPTINIFTQPNANSGTWSLSSLDLSNLTISSIDGTLVNTWLYVKDIATDPYNITLTKPKLTVKCANATMEKDLVVQVDDSFVIPTGTLDITENGTYNVIDKASAIVNVSGGAELEPHNITINFNLYKTGSVKYYIINTINGNKKSGTVSSSTTITGTGNIVIIVNNPNAQAIEVQPTGDYYNTNIPPFSSDEQYFISTSADLTVDVYRFDYDAM